MRDMFKTWGAIILSITFLICLWMFMSNILPSKQTSEDIILEKINGIENKLDSISNKKDSIKTIIVTIEREIEINSKNHEKTVNTIINSSDSANNAWIEHYIEQYKLQHSK